MLINYGKCNKNSREVANVNRKRFPARKYPSHMIFRKVDNITNCFFFRSDKLCYYFLGILAEGIEFSKNTIQIIKTFRYYSFKMHLVQDLRPNDFQRIVLHICKF